MIEIDAFANHDAILMHALRPAYSSKLKRSKPIS